MTPNSVLFVCLGNICRSPSAESVMRKLSENQGLNIVFDSAGTAGYHAGESPDTRAIKVGKSMGYELSNLRARQVKPDDFYRFELILAMDNNNLTSLQALHDKATLNANGQAVATLALFDPTGQAVADPYYGDERDFVAMFGHIERVANDYVKAWQTLS